MALPNTFLKVFLPSAWPYRTHFWMVFSRPHGPTKHIFEWFLAVPNPAEGVLGSLIPYSLWGCILTSMSARTTMTTTTTKTGQSTGLRFSVYYSPVLNVEESSTHIESILYICRGRKMDWRRRLQTSNGLLHLKLGSDRPQTLPKRVSDDPRHFIFRLKFCRNVCKLWRSVYPPRMALIGLKLGQNAFQTIPNISSFDPETQDCCWIFARSHDDMIIWSYDHMIVWSYDHMVRSCAPSKITAASLNYRRSLLIVGP